MTFKISTSEVSTFLTCRQRWMYAHHPSYYLEPESLGVALSRGIVGHEALERYYKILAKTENFEKAEETVLNVLMQNSLRLMHVDSEKAQMISQLAMLLKDYFRETRWVVEKYKIVAVEKIVTVPLPGVSDIEFAGRIDLLLEDATGEVYPWDHKFCYNFWPEMAIKLNPQISNYIWALRELGMNSKEGVLNMSRYRDNAQEKFSQEYVTPNSAVRDMFIKNHVEAAKVIVDLKQKPKVGLKDGVTRSASKFNCEYCPFNKLCYAEAQGLDCTTMIRANFRPNSYGYDSELDVA